MIYITLTLSRGVREGAKNLPKEEGREGEGKKRVQRARD